MDVCHVLLSCAFSLCKNEEALAVANMLWWEWHGDCSTLYSCMKPVMYSYKLKIFEGIALALELNLNIISKCSGCSIR